MNLIFLLLLSTSTWATKAGDQKAKEDIHFAFSEAEINTATVEGTEVKFCPVGHIGWSGSDDTLQLWIGERFFLADFNTGETRSESVAEPDCYTMTNTSTQHFSEDTGEVLRTTSVYCKKSKSEFEKSYRMETKISFKKDSIEITHAYADEEKPGSFDGSFKCTLIPLKRDKK